MIKITVVYGLNEHVLESINNPLVRDIKSNATLRAILGYGDSVNVIINGVSQAVTVTIPDGARVLLETKCNTKAS